MQHTRGFTLIELLVSLTIMVVILSLTFAGVNSARARSRDAKRIADLQTIQSALEQHVLGNPSRTYPPDPAIADQDNLSYCNKYVNNGSQKGIYDNICFQDFLAVVPVDPKGLPYEYRKPGCFKENAGVAGGVELTNETTGCLRPVSSYGLHTVLESDNRREGKEDATPAHPASYDLVP